MFKTKMLIGLAGSLALAAGFANAAGLIEKNISQEEMFIAYDTLQKQCMKPDFKNITMVIVDRAGLIAFQAAPDGSAPHNLELTFRKAYTGRTFRQPSIVWRDRTKEGSDTFGQRQLVNTVPLGGGLSHHGRQRCGGRCRSFRDARRSDGRQQLRQGCRRIHRRGHAVSQSLAPFKFG
jgi:uncharacterized protein GlcG (DUF336 family)